MWIINSKIIENIFKKIENMRLTSTKQNPNTTKAYSNPYNNIQQKQNFSQSSTHSSNNNNITDTFTMSAKMLLPLVMRQQQQNQQLQTQKQKLHDDMLILDRTSMDILYENQRIKQHYYARTTDLQKLVESIGINYGNYQEELRQLMHLYREHNYKLYRIIDQNIGERDGLGKEIEKLDGLLLKQKGQLVEKDKQAIQKYVKTKKSVNKYELLTKNKTNQHQKTQNLEQQINRILNHITDIRNKNILSLQFIKNHQKTASHQKPILQHKTITKIKQTKCLKQQKQALLQELAIWTKKLEENKRQDQYMAERKKDIECGYVQKMRKYQQCKRVGQAVVQRIRDGVGKLKKIMRESQDVLYERNKLRNVVKNKRERVWRMGKECQERVGQMERERRWAVDRIKNDIQMMGCTIDRANKQSWNPQREVSQLKLQQLQQQYERITEKAQTLQTCINKEYNPIQQIISMQYKLNKTIQQSQL